VTVDRYASGGYLEANPTWHVEDSEWKATKIAKILGDNSVSFANMVEVGCGAGQVLRHMSKLFPSATFAGFDISPQASSFWPKPAEGDAVRYTLGDAFASDEHFDVALMLDVFEHVEDYLGFLRASRAIADRFVFHIPLELHVTAVLRDQQMQSRSSLGHLHYFSRATALATLQDAGFRVIDERYTSGALDLSSAKTLKTRVLNPLRRVLGKLSEEFAVKALGGYSLLVLAQPANA
jgi:SAM-dependent methyltransferase